MVRDDDFVPLYAAAPEDFVPARTEIVKRLRAAGDRDGAALVQGLRRPTVAAWAANQLSHHHADEVDALLEIGDELRAVQRRALSGLGGGELREFAAARHALVDRLVETARDELRVAGRSLTAPVLDAVRSTLYAASADPETGELLRRGRLEREAAAAGFGGMEGLSLVAPATRAPRPRAARPDRELVPSGSARPPAADRRKQERLAARREKAATAVESLHHQADSIAGEVATLEQRAQEARHEAARAVELAEAAQEMADAADAALERARKRHAHADREATAAAQDLARIDAELSER